MYISYYIYIYDCVYGAYEFRCVFLHGNAFMASWMP